MKSDSEQGEKSIRPLAEVLFWVPSEVRDQEHFPGDNECFAGYRFQFFRRFRLDCRGIKEYIYSSFRSCYRPKQPVPLQRETKNPLRLPNKRLPIREDKLQFESN